MKITYTLIGLLFLFISSCQTQEDNNNTEGPATSEAEIIDSIPNYIDSHIVISIYQDIYTRYVELGLSHDTMGVKKVAPRYFVQNITKSNRDLSTKERKELFVTIILTNTLLVNEKLIKERDIMLSVLEKKSYTRADSVYLDSLCALTHIKNADYKELPSRFDIIPPSLVIAQAITESAWGTSHFAIEGNSLFGEHMSHKAKGKYIQASVRPLD